MALLTLAEAKAQLNITSDADDTELTAYIEAVGPVIERFVGPVEPQEVVETHDVPRDGGRVLVLRRLPVMSLTSVVPVLAGGPAYDVGTLVLDGDTGVVQRVDGGWLRGPLRVTYQAGRANVPATINLAARMLVQHLWRTQNAGRGPVLAGGDDFSVSEPVPGFGYAVPNRVLQLLEPFRLPPGVA
ncbi:phage gp6-like head-tail connector protein [Streptomyces sp. Babs14]|uniref:head-tail connector protein n=1 Tax=unclassified Streptomyces TaxID=2593676 RepID=UPI001C250369|nr:MULTISPECIES: head-tail connector protein [unclassified Streptomyces]MBU8549790.1 phage gp6-like head-tail connector protein [Streptomyces sp. Osf17]MBU8556573.1 phage gp6-like head-tail connector protein [Streptomyces sp. Babs14]